VDFQNGWLLKSSFITKDEHEACRLTRTKVQQKKSFCQKYLRIRFDVFSSLNLVHNPASWPRMKIKALSADQVLSSKKINKFQFFCFSLLQRLTSSAMKNQQTLPKTEQSVFWAHSEFQ
jgi:hypothetical protein